MSAIINDPPIFAKGVFKIPQPFPTPMTSRFLSPMHLQKSTKEGALRDQWRASGRSVPIASIMRQPIVRLIARGVIVDVVSSLSGIQNEWQTVQEGHCPFGEWELLILKTFGTADTQILLNDRLSNINVLSFSSSIFRHVMMISVLSWGIYGIGAAFKWFLVFLLCIRVIRGLILSFWRGYRYHSVGRPYIGGGSIVEAFTRTVFADHCGANMQDNDGFYSSFWTGRTPSGYGGLEGRLPRRMALLVSLEVCSFHRRLMITKMRYIGLASGHTKVGNFVCVLRGCSISIILRRVNNHFVFVGDSYVHGLMYGETMDMAEGTWVEHETVLH